MYDVFLSHAHEDEQAALLVTQELSESGLRVFFAPRELKPGPSFIEQIQESLKHSQHLLLLATPAALHSGFVKMEWQTFMSLFSGDKKHQLLILLEGEVTPSDLDPFLAQFETSRSLEQVIAAAGGNVCRREREKLRELKAQNESLRSARQHWMGQKAELHKEISKLDATIKAENDTSSERDHKISELKETVHRLERAVSERCRDASRLRRRYALFVHYNLKPGRDWKSSERGLAIDPDVLIPRLDPDLRYLDTVLSPAKDNWGREWDGFAFLLLDPGWTALLSHQGDYTQAARLGMDLQKAKFEIKSQLNRLNTPTSRVRLISAADLINLVALLEEATNSELFGQRYERDLSDFLTGGGSQLLYDGAKVIEGAVRIGNIGRQIPIMRFDDDVIFYGSRSGRDSGTIAMETQRHIIRLCERYRDYSVDPRIDYFAFSGGYVQKKSNDAKNPIEDRPTDSRNAPELLNGFATRVVQLANVPSATESITEDHEAIVSSDVALTFLEGLTSYGANPFRQVVSGAGLCFSDSAILDLPPFSNMRLNVMWIDDHLKYALHHELRHFGLSRAAPQTARVVEACFLQFRHPRAPTYGDVKWHLKRYVLRLMLGCVADAWLRATPALKQDLQKLDQDAYRDVVSRVPGQYAKRFLAVMPGGWKGQEQERQSFEQELWTTGILRLRTLTEAWSAEQFSHTFLRLFVDGPAHVSYHRFKDYLPNAVRDKGLRIVVDELTKHYPGVQGEYRSLDEPTLEQALSLLVHDFADYFEFVRFWKYFVQSVRLLLNRSRDTADMTWMLPFDEGEPDQWVGATDTTDPV